MSTRYTHKDVRDAFAALVEEATANGIDASTWDIDMAGGSVATYKLTGRGTRVLTDTRNHGSIGSSAKEATHALMMMRAAMALVRTTRD